MPTCQKKDQLCRCIDWPDEDFDVEIDHFIRNFEFLHVELEYASLDAGAACAGAVCATAQHCHPKKQSEN